MRRWITVALALAAASLLAVSVQAGYWWSRADIKVEVGPFMSHNCFGGECRGTGLAWLNGPESWMRTGTATWGGGLLSMLLLCAFAAALAAKRLPRLLGKMVISSVVATGVAGALFIARFPQLEGSPLSVDRGVFLFAAGVACGLAAAVLALVDPRARPQPSRR